MSRKPPAEKTLPGLLVVLSGPTGVGKSTVGDELLERHPEAYVRSVSATTRAPRAGEVDGRDYYFYDFQRFREEMDKGWFLEHAEVHGQLYGTPLRPVVESLRAGKVILLIIDVDGAAQVRRLDLDALLIFLEPPSRDSLVMRLKNRGTENEEGIVRRLARVDREMAAAGSYDAGIVNDRLEDCVDRVDHVIEMRRSELAGRQASGGKLYPGLEALGL